MAKLTKQSPKQEDRVYALYSGGGHNALLASTSPQYTQSIRKLIIDFLINDKQTEAVDDTNGVLAP
ncbi:hypothetical protein ACN3E9_07495 [Vibrio pectenicida]|uniref:hypothetical protein n=1 Tax=Vibrio pectenicida TaxID=62763 RepID=UPI003B9A3C4A